MGLHMPCFTSSAVQCQTAFSSSLDILRMERDRGIPLSPNRASACFRRGGGIWTLWCLGAFQHSVITWGCCALRCASHETPARMGHMTATRMPSATTWATTVTPCTAVSASLATQAMASSVERTRTSTAGLTRAWCAWPTQLTTAERYRQPPSRASLSGMCQGVLSVEELKRKQRLSLPGTEGH